MKTKLLSIAFTMLTVGALWSQNTIVDAARPNRFLKPVRSYPPSDTLDQRPISFPFWIVREIALDLEEKQQLELEAQLYALAVEAYQKLLVSLEEKDQKRGIQLELLEKNSTLLQEQLRAEKRSNKGGEPLDLEPQAPWRPGGGIYFRESVRKFYYSSEKSCHLSRLPLNKYLKKTMRSASTNKTNLPTTISANLRMNLRP